MWKPRATSARTDSGPPATKSSLPTLSAHAAGSRRSASARAAIARGGFSVILSDLSYVAVGRLRAPWRIGFPLAATRAAPIVLASAEAAVLALVEAEALDVLPDKLLHELEVVPALGGGGNELRFEQ